MGDVEKIKKIIKESENIVFFGGAGVSTASGIPDFRGTGGLYSAANEFADAPETILHKNYLMGKPAKFYEYYKKCMLYPNAEPNGAHKALARLEAKGKLKAVITQNIDGLHSAAGSKNVIELHGSVARNYCLRCGKAYPLAHVMAADGVPMCSCGGMVRPDVVMYGEMLDADAWQRAQYAIMKADVLIVGGTSLTVYPAAGLLDYYHGKHLIIINKTPTPFDSYAEFVLREPIAEVLEKICGGRIWA
ncbi:MAG: NAD-dependent protein deacylase [Clostridia bacterium]|nr:NAD-dependent protein deacylase [Clostridia bacterium]